MQFNSFIHAYETYANGNEASPTFHSWAGLMALSSTIGRRVWFDQAYFMIYPNLYVVFVGEPGDKKTTAMEIALNLVHKTDTPIAPSSVTKEAITLLMSVTNEKSPCKRMFTINNEVQDYTHLSFFASEIVTMLSAGGNPIGLVDFFTDIYAKDVYDVMTKNKGTDKIIHPYVTVLACMTPEQTGQMLKQTIITGGFSRRVIFVYGKTQSYGVPFPKLTPEQKMAKAFIVTELLEVAKGKWKGQFLMDEEARTFFEVWYNQKHTEMFKPHPAVFKNWLKSKDVILIKIAMLLVVSEMVRPESRVIQLRHLQHGLRLLDEVEPDLTRIFAGAGRNPGAELAHKIAMRLEETGERGLARKQILALFYHEGTSKEIDEAMMFLTSTGKVNLQQTQQDPTKPGVPIYRLAATSK